MPLEEYRKECEIELSFLSEIVQALQSLLSENIEPNSTVPLKDRAAAANFAFSFYNGIENLLKRSSKYCGVPLPKGELWHSELANRFAEPSASGFPTLPCLVTNDIRLNLLKLRKLRHVIAHGYAMSLDWEQMRPTLETVTDVFTLFRRNIESFIEKEKIQEV